MKVLLMGNPNVGKSAIFSRLTGTHVVASNYSGTTVEFTRGKLKLEGEPAELIDVPGAFTLEPTNKAEEVAVNMIEDGDVIINVIDATNLERNLNLTLQLVQTRKPMIVVLNMWDEALEHGIEIDVEALEDKLGVPVAPTCAISGEGIKELRDKLPRAKAGKSDLPEEDIWSSIGEIAESVQKIKHKHPSVRQELSHATVHPVIGPVLAACVLFFSFAFVAYFGDWLAGDVMEETFEFVWEPVTERMSSALGGGGIIHSVLVGQLVQGDDMFHIEENDAAVGAWASAMEDGRLPDGLQAAFRHNLDAESLEFIRQVHERRWLVKSRDMKSFFFVDHNQALHVREAVVDMEQSFGLLTTGLFIPIAVVLPFIFCFYFMLSLLEDIGYLPRLGVLVDTMMHRLGLHGLSIVPMMLGLGCNVPGAMAGRVLETRKERFIASTLLAICVPCMAQIAMVVGLLGQAGIIGLVVVFATLFFLWIALGVLMKVFLKGETPEILVDIPPYRFPYWKSLVQKVYMRMRGFIREALPYVLLGVLIVNLLYSLGVIEFLGVIFGPIITSLFGLPAEAVGALIVGFLRKDVAVGMLAPLGLELRQLIVASVVLVVYFPCVATFVVLFKELGPLDMLKSTLIMIAVALSVGGGLNLLLQFVGL